MASNAKLRIGNTKMHIINFVIKSIFGLLMVFSHVFAESWQCENDVELQCSQRQCEVSKKGEFTPMSVSFDDQGNMSVCAYSGCWEGRGDVLIHQNFLMLAASQLELSTAKGSTESQENISISLDRTDNVVLLKAGAFAHPLHCMLDTPQLSDYRVPVSNAKAHPIFFQGNANARMFRSRLEEAQKGQVNFAGHLIFTSWGCGSSCVQAALINTKNGAVFFPKELSGMGFLGNETSTKPSWEFKNNSRLFVLNGQPANKEERTTGATYLVWEETAFREIKMATH